MTNLELLKSLTSSQMAKYLNERVFQAEILFESEDANERNCATCWHSQQVGVCTDCVAEWLNEEASE